MSIKVRQLIGHQIQSSDGKGRTPDNYPTYCIFATEKLPIQWIEDIVKAPTKWKVVPIYQGDIENPEYIKHL